MGIQLAINRHGNAIFPIRRRRIKHQHKIFVCLITAPWLRRSLLLPLYSECRRCELIVIRCFQRDCIAAIFIQQRAVRVNNRQYTTAYLIVFCVGLHTLFAYQTRAAARLMQCNLGQVLEKIAFGVVNCDDNIAAAFISGLVSRKGEILLKILLIQNTQAVGLIPLDIQCYGIALAKSQCAAVNFQSVTVNLIELFREIL